MERQPPKTPKPPKFAWMNSFGAFGVFGGSRLHLQDDRSPL
jgi:hypothetical protein